MKTFKNLIRCGVALVTAFAVMNSASAAVVRTDYCGVIWSFESTTQLGWINPTTGAVNTTTGPTANIPTLPAAITGASVAATGIHTQSGTIFAFDRNGATGTLYKYKFGTDTAWVAVPVTGLLGLTGTQTIASASNNLNKMTVDGNTLFIAESNGIAVYSVPLNAAGAVTGNATTATYTYVGDPAGYIHTGAAPTGTQTSIAGGDITVDEYGDVYNITYNTTSTKAFFYVQDPVAKTWTYLGETASTASFAGATFYKGDLYVKAGGQLKKVDLTRTATGYTGWNNPLTDVGAAAGASTDLTSCGTPNVAIAKTSQNFTDAAATTAAADQSKVKVGDYIKYTINVTNTGDTWARTTNILDTLPAGVSYVANSATLNGTNLNQATYPSAGFLVSTPGATGGNLRTPPDPNTGTLTFVVQVTGTTTTIQNRATVSYTDSAGVPSEPANCTSTPKLNCADSTTLPVVNTVSGTIWNDSNASIVQDTGETGTNAGGLTVYAIDSTGKIVGKSTVATNGTYSITDLPTGGAITLRLSNDASAAIGATAPAATLPTGWVNSGENVNGTIDSAGLGEIAIATNSLNLANQNFGIRQPSGQVSTLPATSGCTTGNRTALFDFSGLTNVVAQTSPAAQTWIANVNGTTNAKLTVTFNNNANAGNIFTAQKSTFTTNGVTPNVPSIYQGPNPVIEFGGNPLKAGSNITVKIEFVDRISGAPVSVGGTSFALIDVDQGESATVNASNTGTAVTPQLYYTPSNPNTSIQTGSTEQFWTIPSDDQYNDYNQNGFGFISFPGFIDTINVKTEPQPGQTSMSGLMELTGFSACVPITSNDTTTTPFNTPATLSPLTNDTTNISGATITSIDLDPNTPGIQNTITTAQGTFTVAGTNVQFTPVAGFIGTATTPYTITDSNRNESNKSNLSVTVTAPPTVSGKIWDDANASANNTFTNINTGTETGTNAGGLFVNLLDATGKVLATAPVNPDGTYSITSPSANVSNASLAISSVAGTLGQAPPTTLPANWVATSPQLTPTFNISNANITAKDFGIEQLPNSTPVSSPAQINAGGTTQLTVPTLAGTDPEDGTIGTGKSFKITSLPTNGTLYYNGVPVTANQIIANYDPSKLTIDPDDSATVVTFQFAAIDAAGNVDPTPAIATMNFTPPAPSIGAAKSIFAGPTLNANGTFSITYSVLVKNTGNVALTNAQATDDLTATFPAPATFVVSAVSGTNSNPSFNGNTDKNLLSSGVNLAVGDTRTVQYTVTVTPNGNFGTFNNSATATATPPSGTPVSDLSDSGTNPDANNNGNPSDSGENDSTPVTLAAPAPPVATDDEGQTIPGVAINIPIAPNDTANGGLTVVASTIDLDPSTPGQDTTFTVPGKGTFALQPDGTVKFTPVAGFNSGNVTIPYTIKDTLGQTSNVANITASVNIPAAQTDVATTPYQTPVTLNASSNDITTPSRTIVANSIDLDPNTPGTDEKTLTVPGKGTFVANPDGTVAFTPAAGFVGTVSIPYTIRDSAGATSLPADLIVTVTAPAAPVAAPDNSSTPYQTAKTIDATSNDSANGGATLDKATIDLDPSTPGQDTTATTPEGTWSVDNTGKVTFVPANGFVGTATLPYTIKDNLGQVSNTSTINMVVTAPPVPVAAPDNSSTPYQTTKTIDATSNDSANGGATLDKATIDLDPSTPGQDTTATTPEGTWSVDNTGKVTFVPANGFVGTATLPYTIKDNLGQVSNKTNISMTVTAPPAPVASNDNAGTTPNVPVTINVASNDTANGGATLVASTIDLDPSTPGQDTTFTVPGKGTFALQPDGTVKFTPVAGFTSGNVTIPYTIKDNLGQASNTANIVVVVSNAVATPDSVTTAYNTPVTLTPALNDTPSNGATLDKTTIDLDPSTPGQDTTFTVAGKGTFALQPDGTVLFTPLPGFAGTVSTPYTIKDSSGALSNPADLTVVVTAPPPPVASDDNAGTTPNVPVTINIASNDTANGGATLVASTIDLDPSTPGQDTTFTVAGKGTFALQPDGTVKFTPVAGFTSGTVTIPYTIKDNLGQLSNTANIAVVVSNVVATANTANTAYNTPVILIPASDDTASNGATIVASTIDLDPSTPGQDTTFTAPGKGTFALQPDGTVKFTPVASFVGTVSTPYTIKDSSGALSNPADLTVVVATPAAPVANNDNASTALNTAVTVNVASNDTANDGATLDASTIDLDPSTPGQDTTFTVPGKGTFALQPDGTVKFTPVAGFVGVAEIPYTIKDNLGQLSNTANIKIAVAPPAPPIANDDQTSTAFQTPVTLPVLTNDTANGGTTLDKTSIDLDPSTPGIQTTFTVAGKGTFASQPDGTVLFTPDPGYAGVVETPYTVSDSVGQISNSVKIIVTITPPPAPVATDDTTTSKLNTVVTLPATLNDSSAPGTNLVPSTIDLDPSTPGQQTTITVPGKGTFALQPDGTIKFTPVTGFVGTATVQYTIEDNLGQVSNPADLTVTVVAPPKATDDTATTAYNTSVTLAVPSNDTANDGATLVASTIDLDPSTPGQDTTFTVAGKGTFVLQPDGTVLFTPVAGFSGIATTPYTIKDSLGQVSNTANLSVTVNKLPAATDDVATTKQNTPVNIAVASNDKTNPGDAIVPSSIDLDPNTPGQQTTFTVPGKGTFVLQPDGTVSFTPENNFSGLVEIPYTISDNKNQTTAPAKISVTVVAAPVAANDVSSTPFNAPVAVAVASNDEPGNPTSLVPSTIDLDPSTPGQQSSITVAGKGTFVLQPDGTVKFTPVAGFSGIATTPYTIQDALGQISNPANISVNVLPDNPTATNDYVTTDKDQPVVINPIANDNGNGATLVASTIDLDPSTPGQDTTFTVAGKGTFALQPDGTIKFTPVVGFVGTVALPYTIKDNAGNISNPAQIVVTVNALPAAKNDDVTTSYNTAINVPVLNNDTANVGSSMDKTSIDLDLSTPGIQTTTAVPGKGTFTVQPDGTVRFVPVAGFTGTATIPYAAKDTTGKTTNVADISVTVNPPAAPVANNDKTEAAYGSSVSLNPAQNDTGTGIKPGSIDLDPGTPGQQTTFTVPGKGTFTLNPSTGVVTFTPVDGFTGEVSVPYTIEDQFGQTSNPATITVAVGTPSLALEKKALQQKVGIGDTLVWSINLKNTSAVPVRQLEFVDDLPLGLSYKLGSSTLAGAAISDPTITIVNGHQRLTWKIFKELTGNSNLELKLGTVVLPSAANYNSLQNTATASAKAGLVSVIAVNSNKAVAAVNVEAGVFSKDSVILGRVYIDKNTNNSYESGTDTPVAGARVYLSNGRYAVTDEQGNYSLSDVPAGLYALRLDPLTAPFVPSPLPDDQGQPGTRSVRVGDNGGAIDHEDFPLLAPNNQTAKARMTVVQIEQVKLEKTLREAGAGYAIELKITTTAALKKLLISDPLPEGATRGPVYLIGANGAQTELKPDSEGNILLSDLAVGTYTIRYGLFTKLSADLALTDPNLKFEVKR